jgi:hypothetical protein
MVSNCFPESRRVYEIMWKNMVERDRPQMTVQYGACFVHAGYLRLHTLMLFSRLRLKCDGTRAETRFRLSAKQTSPFRSAGASFQSTTGSRGVRISGSNVGYTMFRGSVKSTRYPLHSPVSPSLPSRASPCAITFQLDYTYCFPSAKVVSRTLLGVTFTRTLPVMHFAESVNVL